jgi:hypothetical protein
LISQFKEKEKFHQQALEDARRVREIQEITLMHRNAKRNRHHESSTSSSSTTSSDSINELKLDNYSEDGFDSISDFEAPSQNQKLRDGLEMHTTKDFHVESEISEDVNIQDSSSRVNTIPNVTASISSNHHSLLSV